ncbi:hypothetical protein COY05_01600 [Candidatus Peregrinibacteria bacterium CG_4_10_14_0_2_um_filter_38_24]|nr:MAG: hypothetical protein COY05_01600 [Candidatus Peregrinibacteria bacterium CG_4_10_14_0_2_um_filter_38_24]
MKKYIVSNYMNPKAITLNKDSTFRDAVELMLKKHTNGIVIIDNENKVAGILSSWDLIQYLVPDYLEEDKHLASFETGDTFSTRIDELENDSIMNFASKKVHTIKKTHSIMEAAALLSEFHIRQLPVVDDENKLIGYLNRTDVKKAIGDVLKIKY